MTEHTLIPFNSEQKVIEAAKDLAASLEHSPNHTVAAAVMDVHGRIYTGVNVFHFAGGPCAELVALGNAVAAAAGPLITIAAAGNKQRGIIPPCGRCRQVLLDQHPDIMVAIESDEGPRVTSIRDLLPFGYVHPDSQPARIVRFDKIYFDDVKAGKKTSTVRWRDPISPGPATFVFEDHDQHATLAGEVIGIQSYALATLTAEQAHVAADTNMDEFRQGLRQRYERMPHDAEVEAVEFRVME